jgi:hypothetical protein
VAINFRPVAHPTPIPAKCASEQCCCFAPGQVALSRRGLGGQPNRNRPVNFALLPAPPKRGSQDNKLAARRRRLDGLAALKGACIRLPHTPLDVFVAGCAGYCRYCATAEEIEQLADCGANQIWTACGWCVCLSVFRKRVGYKHLGGMPFPEVRTMFLADVIR